MADPSPPSPAPRRRFRRWLRRVMLVVLLLLVVLWVVKVPVANWALHRLPGDWEISITGVKPGGSGVKLEGVRVVHRPTGRQMTFAKQLVASNGWSSLLHGRLGSVEITDPEVEWRAEFETPYVVPPEGGPPAVPLVEWEKCVIHGGVFRWYEAGREAPRLALNVAGFDGGKLSIYNDGRLEATPQNIIATEVVSREYALSGAMEIVSSSPRVTGAVSAQRELNRYTVETVNLQTPECRVTWHRGGDPSAGAAPAVASGAERPEWDKPVEFFIRRGTADQGRVLFTLHTPTASGPLEFDSQLQTLVTSEMRIGGGLPYVFGPTEATLTQVKSPATTVTAREVKVAVTFDDKKQFHVSSAAINGARVEDSRKLLPALGYTPGDIKPFAICKGEVDARGTDLLVSAAGVQSAAPQQATFRDLTVTMPNEKDPMLQAPSGQVSAVPDEVRAGKRLRSVVVERPEVKITENVFTDELNPLNAGAPPPAPPAPGEPVHDKPRWYGWNADSLTVKNGQVRGVDLGTGIPDATGAFSVATAPREAGGESYYSVHVDNIALSNPVLAALTKVEGVMDIDVHPLKVWETEAIDQVRVNGMKVELGEAFLKLFQAKEEPGKTPAPPAGDAAAPRPVSTPGRPWKVNRVIIENSEIAIDNIGDGRRLVIPIRRQQFNNVPLNPSLVEHDAAHTVQKVEVPAIYLYSPYLTGVTVAELPVNFIYFTFAGLMEKRLERVELLAPKIKAGAPLFDFIKRVEQRWSPATEVPVGAGVPIQVPAANPPVMWDIPFYTEMGSVITAPNGFEWEEIPRLPFRNARERDGPNKGRAIPFRLHGEQAHGELAIEPGWYEFPEYRLRIRMSDEGRVVFNFPLKEHNNNLVEVFQNNTVIYRQLEIQKVWLSVTYDQQGIYVGFGGETCGGYITGKFNLYLDQMYSWDASASFTGINMKPLSGKLLREYALIDGVVDSLNVTAYGDMTGLYQTTANLSMKRSGRLQLKCLDELRARLVKERVSWKDDLGRIGVDTLRDFAFTSCEGSARLFGQEGRINLVFKGRDGSRDFTVNLKDYRNRPEKSLVRF